MKFHEVDRNILILLMFSEKWSIEMTTPESVCNSHLLKGEHECQILKSVLSNLKRKRIRR